MKDTKKKRRLDKINKIKKDQNKKSSVLNPLVCCEMQFQKNRLQNLISLLTIEIDYAVKPHNDSVVCLLDSVIQNLNIK